MVLKRGLSPHALVPALAQLAAVALLATIAAYWTLQWFFPAPAPRIAVTAEPAGDIGAAMDLFGAGPSAVAAQGDARNGVRLAGVVAAREGREAYAVVIVDGKDIAAIRKGDDIVAGARLVEVAPDHIVIDRQGVRETLGLPEKGKMADGASVRKDR